jgi:hypothetical protein
MKRSPLFGTIGLAIT